LAKAKPADRKRLLSILKSHTSNRKSKDEAIEIMNRYDSIEYAKQFAEKLVTESWKEIDRLLTPSRAKDELKAFADHLVKRNL
jgi:geranylgeranyl pyrophosphate synthase